MPGPEVLAADAPFWRQSVNAPSSVYFTGEDALRLSTIGNAASLVLMVSGRTLGPDNVVRPFQFTHVPNSNRTVARDTCSMPEGWLLGVEVKVTTGTPSYGAVWSLLEVTRGLLGNVQALQAIGADFVTVNSPLVYPGAEKLSPLDGQGCLRAIVGTQPAAGAEILETVPTNARWEVLAFLAALVTNANAANRVPALTIDDGANVFFETSVNNNETAALTWLNVFSQGANLQFDGTRHVVNAPLPANNRLGAGFRLKTITAAIDPADQYAAPKYLVREWFDV